METVPSTGSLAAGWGGGGEGVGEGNEHVQVDYF